MEAMRLEVCIYENEYRMCVSLVLLQECVTCPFAWCVCVVCVVHMGYVVFTYGCMLIGCVVSPLCTSDMWNLSHLKSYYMYGWFYSGVEYSKSL